MKKFLFSNIGYAKGIDGTLWQHICRFNRHFYCNTTIQEESLFQLKEIINVEKPDVCCLVEVDQGSVHSMHFNQIEHLIDDEYQFYDVANKYGDEYWLNRLSMLQGKCNAFLARHVLPFERMYFKYGTKRLVYRITLPNNLFLFFAHFSLNKKIRAKQLQELHLLVKDTQGDIIIVGDFNIMSGFSELKPLLNNTDLKIMNDETLPTFKFHKRKLALDLCICSSKIAEKAHLRVIPQSFSDHDALILELET